MFLISGQHLGCQQKKEECKCSDFLPQRCQKYNERITQVVVG